jgi:cell division protein FtsI/penicillin-binding protein 2
MKKVKRRAGAALLLAGLLVVGLVIYLIRLADGGQDWVMFRANNSVYSGGVLDTGTLTDRDGVVLAHAGDGVYYYADDPTTRLSCFHAVGDYTGNVGTGAVNAFAYKLAGYNIVTGAKPGGATVALTIDADLNNAAYEALWGRKGAVLVSNYETGEILCMVSTPVYDPQSPPSSFEGDQYEGVFLNRCISSTFTPGSVFKLVTVAAAIENIGDLSTRSFSCAGSVQVGDQVVTCTGWHGEQTIEQALANSCNCAFAALSLELGADRLAEYADKLGLTVSHELDGIETVAGSFEKAEADTADLAWSGIGQYNDLVSPYALLRLVSAIAAGGEVTEPHILMDHGLLSAKEQLLAPETADQIAAMMSYTVQYNYGTWNFPNLNVCAKTGTAEVGDGTSHAWIAGFLDDAENPLAFVVMVEHGGGGLSAAGPVANAVLQAAVS